MAIHAGYFKTWPWLTISAINCHIKTIDKTVQGHLNQPQQGLHFTKEFIYESPPTQTSTNECTHLCTLPLKNNLTNYTMTKLADFPPPQIGGIPILLPSFCMMQMQSLPYPSKIIVIQKSPWLIPNGINLSPQKVSSHEDTSSTIKYPWQSKNSSETNNTYNTPHLTSQNAAEEAIQTWKTIFIAGIAGTPNSFPLAANFWYLTNLCNYMLNMLWPNWQNPNLSAFKAHAVHTHSMPCPWHHQIPCVMSALISLNASHGDATQSKHGTLALNLTTIGAMKSLLKTLEPFEYWIWSHLTTMPSPYPQFPTPIKYSRPPSTSKLS